MKAILLLSFVFVIESAGEPCSTANHFTVVNICTKETVFDDKSNTILVKSDKRKNCTCELSLTDQNQSITINFQRFGSQTSSYPSYNHCGLILKFSVGNDLFGEANCGGVNSVSKPIVQKEKMTIRSVIVNGTLQDDHGYCIEIKKAVHVKTEMINLTCGVDNTTTTQTTTKSAESSPKITTTSNSPPMTSKSATVSTTMEQFTFVNVTTSDGSEITKQVNLEQINSDDKTVLAAGASVGGLVIIIVLTVVICTYRRYHQKPISKQDQACDNESDDYGMRDNVLYVSSQSTDTVEQQDTKRISVDIDGNYSTVDLDEILSVEESTGNYSSIDLVNPTPTAKYMNRSAIKKPIIAKKPKQKVAIQEDVYSVPDNERVKHVTAPGEHGCEYAVVSKPNKSNVDKSEDQPSTSNVYAVVTKSKRLSNGKGTNQKRDSLTSENDRETGRTSKS